MPVIEEVENPAVIHFSKEGRRVPDNWTIEFRGIGHIGNIEEYPAGRDAHMAALVEKYRRIDAGLDPDTGLPKPERNKAAGLYSPRDSAGSTTELIQQIAALKEQVEKLSAEKKQEDAPDPNLLAERDALLEQVKELSASEDPRDQAAIDAAGRGEEEGETVLSGYDDEPEPVKTEESLTGKGQCPYCKKDWKRLEMHVPRCPQGPETPIAS